MTPKQRKIALLEADVLMSDIARDLGVTVAHVSAVVLGKRRSPTVEQAVAKAIRKPVSLVFEQQTATSAA